jgi:hypothetical protein
VIAGKRTISGEHLERAGLRDVVRHLEMHLDPLGGPSGPAGAFNW